MEKYLELTKNLISEFDKSTSDYFEIHISEFSLTLKKGSSCQQIAAMPENKMQALTIKDTPLNFTAEEEIQPKSSADTESLQEIKSPIVGVFYEAKDPESEPFVKIGQKVKKGDVLCILESMKMMNEIRSDYDGIVKEIKCKNEELVEFGQVMFVLES